MSYYKICSTKEDMFTDGHMNHTHITFVESTLSSLDGHFKMIYVNSSQSIILECTITQSGWGYTGTQSHTISGLQCQM